MSATSLSYLLQSEFHLPPEAIRHCDKYYILYWQSSYVYVQLLKDSNRIIRESLSYTPVFLSGLSIEELGKDPGASVKLSFRKLRGKAGGYVLISRTSKVTGV